MKLACNNCGFGKPTFYRSHNKYKPTNNHFNYWYHEGKVPSGCLKCGSPDLDLCLEGHDHKCRRGTVTGYCGRCGVDDPCYSSTVSETLFTDGVCSKSGNGANFTHTGPCLCGQPVYHKPQEEPKKCENGTCEHLPFQHQKETEPQEDILTVVEKEIKHIIESSRTDDDRVVRLASFVESREKMARKEVLNLPCMQESEAPETHVVCCPVCYAVPRNELRREIKDALQSK